MLRVAFRRPHLRPPRVLALCRRDVLGAAADLRQQPDALHWGKQGLAVESGKVGWEISDTERRLAMVRHRRRHILTCFAGLLCISASCQPAGAPAGGTPEADDQLVSVAFNTPTPITLTASDPDGGPQALAYSIVSQPQHGTLTGTPPSVTYTPDTGYSGPDSFTFKANDGAADSDPATVSITVQAAGAGSTGTTEPFTTYRGTFHLTWQHQSAEFGTQSSEASGTVEFGNPIDITQLWTQYGPGTAFEAITANSPALVSNYRSVSPEGATATQVGGGTAKVSWGWLYILNSGQVAFELNVNGHLTETDCPPPGDPQPCFTRDSAAAFAGFSGGGCPLVFVAAGPDLARLEGTASETCTQTVPGPEDTVITQIATLTWDLTGS